MLSLARSRVCYQVCKCWKSLSFSTRSLTQLQSALAERCILVNSEDSVIGDESKFTCHRVQSDGSLLLHRAFSVFLFNTKGEILLQQRSANKITFPLHYTNACCSHPLYDIPEERCEDDTVGIKLAAQRRLNYELGIPCESIKISDFNYITRIHYSATDDNIWGEHEIDYILFLKKDVELNLNEDEVADAQFVKQENFDKFLKSINAPITPWFKFILQHHLPLWWKNLNNLKNFEDHKTIHKFNV